MFKSIHLQNFQGHQDTLLELSPGVNMITGPSNVGKSSIIRAIWWLCRNRPMGAGDNYRHRDADKKEPTSVKIALDNGVITRFKRGTHNGYTIGEEDLVAIRTDVPSEVSRPLNMGDHNLQLQHQSYFLVADSPGEVAQKLNEVAGLDVIDACLKNTGLLVSRNQADTRATTDRLADLDESIKAYDDIADRDEAVATLETLAGEVDALEEEAGALEEALALLKKVQSQREETETFLKVEAKANELLEMENDLIELDNEILHLADLIKKGTRLGTERRVLEGEIKSMEAEFHALSLTDDVCPLCGQKIK